MENEVAAEVERALAAGRRQGVVGDDQRAGRLGLGGAIGDVDDAEQRIARSLDPDQSRLVRDRGGEGALVALIDERGAQLALILEPLDQPIGAAIAIVRRDDARTGRQQQQRKQGRRLARIRHDAARGPFELGKRFGQHVAIGIDRARIIIGRLGVGIVPAERVRRPDRRHQAVMARIAASAGRRDDRSWRSLAAHRKASTRAETLSASFRNMSWP